MCGGLGVFISAGRLFNPGVSCIHPGMGAHSDWIGGEVISQSRGSIRFKHMVDHMNKGFTGQFK